MSGKSKQPPNSPAKPARLYDESHLLAYLSSTGISPHEPRELRILRATYNRSGLIETATEYPKTLAGWYDSADAMQSDLRRLDCALAYITVNHTTSDLLARSYCNPIKARNTTRDEDIPVLRYCLIDLDAVRPPDISSTDDELKRALARRDQILADHPDIRAASIWGCSGNGGWIVPMFPDYPNDPDHREMIAKLIGSLARLYSDDRVKVDVATKNPARIMALPGSLKCKGSHRPERPWRLVTVDSPHGQAVRPMDAAGWIAEHWRPEPERGTVAFASQAAPAGVAPRKGGAGKMSDDDFAAHRCRSLIFGPTVAPSVAGQGGHDQLFHVAAIIWNEFGLGDAAGLAMFREWNQVKGVPPETDAQILHKWDSVKAKYPTPSLGMRNEARPDAPEAGDYRNGHANGHMNGHADPRGPGGIPGDAGIAADGDRPNEAIHDPHRLARVVRSQFLDANGFCRLTHFRDDFYLHDGLAYRIAPDFRPVTLVNRVKAELDERNVEALARWNELPPEARGQRPQVHRVTTGLITDVTQAIRAMVNLDRDRIPPFWIDEAPGQPRPADIIPVANGLLHVTERGTELLPHTPEYFCFYALPYDYMPSAPRPDLWLKLLEDQWGGDQESIDTLHEEFGYLLTPDTSLQKMFFWIGPTRSGRGTIKDVVIQLIGPENVAATSPVALGDPFGLEPLMSKTVAFLGDARTSDTHDMAVMVDRLLRITGRDPVEVNRKGRPILANVRMPLRFVYISNEMPMFRDAAGAITTRYLIIKANRTIPPEQRIADLVDRITRDELPGILNLAIEGLRRLRHRGRFLQPSSAADLLDVADEIASPAKQFADDCLMQDPDAEMATADAFTLWRLWAASNGYHAGNVASFGKNLKAAVPTIKKSRHRRSEENELGPGLKGGDQPAVYIGIEPNVAGLEMLARWRSRKLREGVPGSRNQFVSEQDEDEQRKVREEEEKDVMFAKPDPPF